MKMLNGEILQDKETKKWGYIIWIGKTEGKILKESTYEFETEKDAKKKFDLEFSKYQKQLIYNPDEI